jgi:hypothetical protein
MDHRKDFEWLVLEKMGEKAANSVDWSAPRLICVAGDFNRYDGHAVKQIRRNIELIRYRRFGTDLLMLDLVATTSVRGSSLDGKAELTVEGDRGFESTSLQRGVCLTGAFHGCRRKGPAFAGSVSLGETRERDVLATSRLALAPFL